MKTLDINEAAEFLKVHRNTALELAERGDLIGAKIGRAWVFLEDDLVEFLRAQSRQQTRERQNLKEGRELETRTVSKSPFNDVSPLALKRRARRSIPTLPEAVS
jgi:excisionase family DNA binding protein